MATRKTTTNSTRGAIKNAAKNVAKDAMPLQGIKSAVRRKSSR